MNLLYNLWNLILEISPYLLFGFLISGILSIYLNADTIKKYLGRNSFSSILYASFLGVPLPLCSCGVIPVSAYLRKHGASKAATSSFLISTPQTGVDSIFITYSLLGPILAIYRPIVALLSGLLGGGLTHIMDSNEHQVDFDECKDECCDESQGSTTIMRILNYGFVRLPLDIVTPLVLGLFVSSIIAIFIPSNYFELYGSGIIGMIIMLFLGLPTYVCATASVPIAFVLYTKGFSLGAVLVFLMTGPATNITTISVCWKILGKKSTLIYLLTIIISAISAGLFLDYLIPQLNIEQSNFQIDHLIGKNIHKLCAYLLIGIIVNSIRIKYNAKSMIKTSEKHISISIKGMTCSHCEESVQKTLMNINGITKVIANAKSGKVIIHGENYSIEKINEEIHMLGFKVINDE